MTQNLAVTDAAPGVAVVVTAGQLRELLDRAHILREDPTGPAGPIRTMRVGDRTFVEESTPGGEHVVRRFRTSDAAASFVAARLAAYDRMWDG